MSKHLIHNPIIPGNYPDPTICRVGEDFYLVNSSFEEYPGLPIFHSKDLANWEQIGNVMTLENGFELDATRGAGGCMAATIRYHKGVFYVINANFSHKNNYIVTATDPAGPWSDPHFLPDVPGIDASLFFDDDDKCYIISTGMIVNPEGRKERGIWCQEFDIENFCLVGERHDIWNSALHDAASPEAPHIYKKDGWYYLIIAEGGTEYYHAVTVARAKHIFDWYEGNPANPILTHRHLGETAPITNIGHADFVELPDGTWYAVMLGSRNYNGYRPYGRESFICPMRWELGWPVVAWETGKVEFTYPAPQSLPWTPYPALPAKDDFDGTQLRYGWVFDGAPYQDFWRVEDSQLKLKCMPRAIDRKPALFSDGRRETEPVRDDCLSAVQLHQTKPAFTATTKLQFNPQNEETAGMFIGWLNTHLRIEIFQNKGKNYISCCSHETTVRGGRFERNVLAKTIHEEVARKEWDSDTVVLQLRADGNKFSFYYGADENNLELLAQDLSINYATIRDGNVFGLFASANGAQSENWACFDWFIAD